MPLNFSHKPQATVTPMAANPLAHVPLQPQQPLVPASIFDGIDTARPSMQSNYLKDGTYYVLIRECIKKLNAARRPMVIFGMTVCGVISTDPTVPSLKLGEECSHILMADNQSFLGNMKAAILGIFGYTEDQVQPHEWKPLCEQMTGQDQPVAGKIVEIVVKTIMTRGAPGKPPHPFTTVSYKREVLPSELGAMPEMDETLADRIFGKGQLQAAMNAELAAQG